MKYCLILLVSIPCLAQRLVDGASTITPEFDCQYRVEGSTTADPALGGTATPVVHLHWTVSWQSGSMGQTHSGQANKSKPGTEPGTQVEFSEVYSLPSYSYNPSPILAPWEGSVEGFHSMAEGAELKTSGHSSWLDCNWVTDDDDPGCTGVITKTAGDDPCDHSPIVIDLNQNGFLFGGPDDAVWFDLYNDGNPLLLQWVVSGQDDAFLFHDIDGNGLVTNGGELFGNGTVLYLENRLAPNGFVGLAQHDRSALGGNENDRIDPLDAIWSELLLWLDINADGQATHDEILLPAEVGLNSLDTIPMESRIIDQYGNRLRYWAFAYGHNRLPMVDVFFREVR